MRLQSHVWVAAYLRLVDTNGAAALLFRRGEASAGAIYVKVSRLDGTADLYSPALSLTETGSHDRSWQLEFGSSPRTETEVDGFLKAQVGYDADIWIIEVEDAEGRHFLGDQFEEG